MADEVKTTAENTEVKPEPHVDEKGGYVRGGRRNQGGRDNKNKQKRGRTDEDGFDSKVVNVRRVSRMHKGGRRMRLSVFVVVGDYKGHIGAGLGKGADVASAQRKAVSRAKKNLITVETKGNTIPHEVDYKLGATKLILKPAAPGTGLKAGSSVKAVVELAGIKDVLSKLLGSTNSVNAVYATMAALSSISSRKENK